jgi:DNA-binding SARP family transcriptional activator
MTYCTAARASVKRRSGLSRASLRNALSTLRRKLGPALLHADRETVQLNPDFHIWVDAGEFQGQAQRYLEDPTPAPDAVDVDLYGGDLLADFYADWLSVEREALRDLYLKTLLELTQHIA